MTQATVRTRDYNGHTPSATQEIAEACYETTIAQLEQRFTQLEKRAKHIDLRVHKQERSLGWLGARVRWDLGLPTDECRKWIAKVLGRTS